MKFKIETLYRIMFYLEIIIINNILYSESYASYYYKKLTREREKKKETLTFIRKTFMKSNLTFLSIITISFITEVKYHCFTSK